MAYTPTRFIGPIGLTATQDLYYTANTKIILKQLILSNIYQGLLSCSIWIVPNTASGIADVYKILGDCQIDANTVVTIDLNQVLNINDKIYASANVPNGINIVASGVTVA